MCAEPYRIFGVLRTCLGVVVRRLTLQVFLERTDWDIGGSGGRVQWGVVT